MLSLSRTAAHQTSPNKELSSHRPQISVGLFVVQKLDHAMLTVSTPPPMALRHAWRHFKAGVKA